MYNIEMASNNHVDPWKSVLSGTGAAILANFLVYPLDVYVFPFSFIGLTTNAALCMSIVSKQDCRFMFNT